MAAAAAAADDDIACVHTAARRWSGRARRRAGERALKGMMIQRLVANGAHALGETSTPVTSTPPAPVALGPAHPATPPRPRRPGSSGTEEEAWAPRGGGRGDEDGVEVIDLDESRDE